MASKPLRRVRQGGMGFNYSDWKLAKTVSRLGGYGTVSGVALDRALAVTLQKGDPGGHCKRALSHFPYPYVVKKVWDEYYVEGGIPKGSPHKVIPIFTVKPPPILIALSVCGVFAWVWLAKEEGDEAGINFMDKIGLSHPYEAWAARQAGVDWFTVGAGPLVQWGPLIQELKERKPLTYRVPVTGENIRGYTVSFDPESYFGKRPPPVKKEPEFIPIVGEEYALPMMHILTSKFPPGSIHGLVVERDIAGGHNAPKRNRPLDYGALAKYEIPYWIGGGCGSPEMVDWALSMGAVGVQDGSIFALSDDSGMDPSYRAVTRYLGYLKELKVLTTDRSPADIPFKVAQVPETLADDEIYTARVRRCKHGFLAELYERPNGTIGTRCRAEPEKSYAAKGGTRPTKDALCLCDGLISAAGMGDPGQPPLITLGEDLSFLPRIMIDEYDSYTVADVMEFLRVA